jgi:hypothetical protein
MEEREVLPLIDKYLTEDTLPLPAWTFFSLTGPRAYVKYARHLRSAHVPALPIAA